MMVIVLVLVVAVQLLKHQLVAAAVDPAFASAADVPASSITLGSNHGLTFHVHK